jgi:hypothetical protein
MNNASDDVLGSCWLDEYIVCLLHHGCFEDGDLVTWSYSYLHGKQPACDHVRVSVRSVRKQRRRMGNSGKLAAARRAGMISSTGHVLYVRAEIVGNAKTNIV